MRFKAWAESEASMGSGSPEMMVNRGSGTPASDEVLRTGLQPQVDSQEIHTDEKDETDKILAIDAGVHRLDSELPVGDAEAGSPKVNKFRALWDELRSRWEAVKVGADEDDEERPDGGLGTETGDQNYLTTMKQHPNMVPVPEKLPGGPGTFGLN